MITVLDQPESAVLPASDRLETGMHLRQPEFERRYNLHPNTKKAELINGFVIMGSPVSIQHGSYENGFGAWLGYYMARLGRYKVVHNTTLRIDLHNEVQPDIAVIEEPGSVKPSLFIEEPPKLIVEIASTSLMYDRYEKYDLYERCRIAEYVLFQIEEARLSWFELDASGYREIAPDTTGILRSPRFPGLWLNPTRITSGDMQGVFADLDGGLASPEFLKFRAEMLAQR